MRVTGVSVDGRRSVTAASGMPAAWAGRARWPGPRPRPRQHASLVITGALCALLCVVTGCSSGTDSVDQAAGGGFGFVQQASNSDFVPVENRTPAPILTGPTVTGPELDLTSYRGRIIVVNFWASWCAPCRAETPGLVTMAADNPQVAFVGVNEKDNLSAAKAFIRDNGVNYPSIIDRIGTLAARWPVPPGLPSTFVLDAKGRLAARFTGGVLPDELMPMLTRLRAET
ncbi:TlpA family protein disulfide reductase [Frankia sp. Cj3]|uniref:TlpA family protein disulfide reductase n=2 Tax=unclassified Frankia TaxID=2632575 RepID=UPI00351D6D71